MRQNPAENTGLSAPEIDHDTALRPATMHWMTEELIEETMCIWSDIYGRQLSHDEAVQILRNVRNYYEVITKAME